MFLESLKIAVMFPRKKGSDSCLQLLLIAALKLARQGVVSWAKQVGSFKVLVIAPCGYVKASMPDLLRSVDNAPQFKDVFREILAMKDLQCKKNKLSFKAKTFRKRQIRRKFICCFNQISLSEIIPGRDLKNWLMKCQVYIFVKLQIVASLKVLKI